MDKSIPLVFSILNLLVVGVGVYDDPLVCRNHLPIHGPSGTPVPTMLFRSFIVFCREWIYPFLFAQRASSFVQSTTSFIEDNIILCPKEE